MKKYLYAIPAILTIFLCYLGYDYYKQQAFFKAVAPIIKHVSLRVGDALAYEVESRNITYDALMALLQEDISETDDDILEIQRMAADTSQEKADVLLSYILNANNVLRSQMSMTRTYLDWKLAMVLFTQDVNVYNTLGVREIDRDKLEYARETLAISHDAMSKKAVDVYESIKKFESSAVALSNKRAEVSRFLPDDVMVDAAVLENVMNTIRDRKAAFLTLTGLSESVLFRPPLVR